jgi:Mg-chelatase subunit ChlD
MNASNNSPMTCADNARRGSLARLLATENLHVEHAPEAQTASFDLNSRTLTLPVWDKANPHTYDMLVGHEVGHALFTPNAENGWCEAAADIGGEAGRRAAQSFLNIVEDARIERLIQNRYPGLRKDFFHGYRDIWNQGFFGASAKDVRAASLPDRLNMHFKVGSFITVPFFNDAEREFVKRIGAALTWQEVVAISRDLFNYMKNPNPPEPMDGEDESEDESEDFSFEDSSDDGESMEFDATEDESEDDAESPEGESGSGKPSDGEDEADDDGETEESANRKTAKSNAGTSESAEVPDASATDEAIRQHMDRLNGPTSRGRVIHAYLPKPKVKNIVRDYKRVLSDIGYLSLTANSEYDGWSGENRKTVELMAKAFDLKKAAEATARTSIRRTGVLDTGSLHKYRFTEDIFRKSSFTREGKNHGMILILDWSGSMSGQMLDTVKQLITLVGFCRRIAIPFEVYAFTDRHEVIHRNLAENGIGGLDQCDDDYENRLYAAQWEARDGKLPVSISPVCLLNLFSSRMNRAETDQISKTLFNMFSGYSHAPRGYSLGGTPMNCALLAVREIAKDFRKANRVEILNTVILTDGEASDSVNWVKFKDANHRNEEMRWVNGCAPSVVIHDGESGRQWFGDSWAAATANIVNCLRADAGTKVIQMMIGYSRMSTNYYDAGAQKTWSEEGFIETTKHNNLHGWDAAFIIKSSAKEVTMEELLNKKTPDKVTTTNIKNAFIKQMKSRTSSRVLVNRLTDLIA